MITTSVTIEKYHKEWIESNSINLSKFLRKRIDEAIENQKLKIQEAEAQLMSEGMMTG